jgi:SAM-dependent methyltransferase
MDAEALEFPDRRFDLIVCAGVLHHLDVARAYPQLARVLAPDGRILCTEPLGYNPAIQLYRRLTPHMRTAWEADHILTRREIDLAGRWFAAIDLTYFHLADLMAYPLRQTRLLTPALGLLGRLDQLLLSVPGLQLMAWQVVMVLSEPHPPQGR